MLEEGSDGFGGGGGEGPVPPVVLGGPLALVARVKVEESATRPGLLFCTAVSLTGFLSVREV